MLVERKEHKEPNGEIGYIESVFDSRNVLKTTYFPINNKLYIAFNRGNTYSYLNVIPQKYQEFENAESQGKFFRENFLNKKEYPCVKEFSLYPNEIKDLKEVVDIHKNKNIDE